MQNDKRVIVGQIAEQLGRPVHAVQYVIRARGIEPCGRAGTLRLFDEPAVERIASELRRIDELRGSKAG